MVLTKYQTHRSRLPRYDIHPISIKMLDQGNPWVTKDKYSEKFHPKERFIVALNRKKPFALLLHDPNHKTVRARLWSKSGNFEKQIKNFKNELAQRIHKAFKARKDQSLMDKRSNVYLLFGEADQVPGLFVQYIGGEILIQFYAHYWERYQDYVIQTVLKKMNDVFKMDMFKMQVWLQTRVEGAIVKEPPYCLDPNTTYKNITVNEFGANYKVNLGQYYDTGLYTDMSSVRDKLTDHFKQANKVLNLYAYTGAFSLFALQNEAQQVTSIDLSENYLEWLEENIELNEHLDKDKHRSMAMSALEGLKKLVEEGEKFDLIICDPPSSSSDGQKRTNALKEYEKLIPLMYKLLTEDGKMVVFLNTHKINKKKFQFKLHDVIKYHKLPLTTGKFLGLNQDCPAMPRFPEGSYLKGFIIDIDQKRKEKLENNHLPKKEESLAEEKVETVEQNAKAELKEKESDGNKEAMASKKKASKKATKKKTAKKKTAKKVVKKTTKKVTKKAPKKKTT